MEKTSSMKLCDVVMKGGITSGVIYPRFVAKLSSHFQLKNIGGSSAGAIAACAAAAAEYNRRKSGNAAAFQKLQEIPSKLSATAKSGKGTTLFGLFQPTRGCHRIFAVLSATLNAKGTSGRWGKLAFGLAKAYGGQTAFGIACAATLGWQSGSLGIGLVASLLLVPLFVTIGLLRDIQLHVVPNGFGICTGMPIEGNANDALTPWLHGLIQDVAGKAADEPLTFGELWDAPGYPPAWMKVPDNVTFRSIDLRVFTTNLSTQRPFVFPANPNGETCRLFFIEAELVGLFPPAVVRTLVQYAKPYQPKNTYSDPPAERAPAQLLELPDHRHLPILFVARMSLSFPGLFASIPLWAIDYDPPRGERYFARCFFSDGGICSNFPIHLFDGLVPLWPTFGISLEAPNPFRQDKTYLPCRYSEGYGERWLRFAERPFPPLKKFGGFLASIMTTMQNWNDIALSRMPGVRDRVVRVRLEANEGGANLNMEPGVISNVAARGEEAADKLIARFVSSNGWDEHRWIRYCTFAETMAKKAVAIRVALGALPNAKSISELVELAEKQDVAGRETRMSAEEVVRMKRTIDGFEALSSELLANLWGWESISVVPDVDVRVRPAL